LKNLKTEFFIVFEKYNYKFLYGKHKPTTEKNLIAMVKRDLKETCKKFFISFNIKSQSFRTNIITNLLKITSRQNTANIIGHPNIQFTLSYNHYSLSKTEIQNLVYYYV